MCGIAGYVGEQSAARVVLDALSRLEYRGYDSAGIAILTSDSSIAVRRAPGKLKALVESMNGEWPKGNIGIGHTRWATHGSPTVFNAHPHSDCSGNLVIVHNGIVENYQELKQELIGKGHTFTSQTDSEVIAHLMEAYLAEGHAGEDAIRKTATRLRGSQAVVALNAREPQKLLAFRLGNSGGIVVGYGKGEMFLTSDLPGLLQHTRRVVFLAPREVASVTREGARFLSLEGKAIVKELQMVNLDPLSAAKGGYKHFMLKEIMEQPEMITSALSGRISIEDGEVKLENFPYSADELRSLKRIVLVGMGSSYYAAMVGKLVMEQMTGLPCEVDNASEFRYRSPVLDRDTLVVAVGQSGETADTLAAMEEALHRGARLLTVCNVDGSQATRLAQGVVLMRAGLEIGVAATKTFTTAILALYLLAFHIGLRRGVVKPSNLRDILAALAGLPDLMKGLVASTDPYEALARKYSQSNNFLFIGRGLNHPIALEGALKLKEISYIHAEGLSAGEMKHGPIALINEGMPVVAIAPRDHLYEKMLSNVSEAKARGARVIALGTGEDEGLASKADEILYLPPVHPLLTPLVAVLPLQLLAYHIAVRRGCDVDQPRNLAKSVTVE